MFTENALFLRYGCQTFSAFGIKDILFLQKWSIKQENEGLEEGQDTEKGKESKNKQFSFICCLRL